jgi:tetratricopeptide (TPR) repeat protein
MELVRGVPLTEYCDTHQLSTRQRLDLFISICQGVQHAHQKGVIHRDLKPSNLLVTLQDGKPVPKIIDFGIAKAMDQRLTDNAFATELGQMIGTPAYMSPEQAEASGLDVDTRTDIYSLGIVLYQLVTGVLPFDPDALGMSPFAAQHILREKEAPTPSQRFARLTPGDATPVALRRHTTPVGLRRELKGDLDWIVLKAIEKDRSRRYETANGLGVELQRYLDNQPVSARPPSATYALGKFVRRHRLGVTAGATAAILLVGVAIAMAVLAERIALERNRAELEAAKAQSINAFLQDMLKSADPWQGGARQTTVLQALQAATGKVDAGFAAQPLVAASIKRTIGTVYLSLGRTADAAPLLRTALLERTSRLGLQNDETAQSLADLGSLYLAESKLDSAGLAFQRALDIRRKLRGPDDTLVAASLTDQVDLALLLGEFGRMDSLARQVLAIRKRAYGDRNVAVASALRRVAEANGNLGRYKEAEPFARSAVSIIREVGGPRHPELVSALNELALLRMYQQDFVEAETLLKQVVALDSLLFGPNHPQLAGDLENLGNVYYSAKRYDASVGLLRQVLAMRREMLPDDDPAIGRTIANTATVLRKAGDQKGAQPLFEDAVARLKRALGPDHPDVMNALGSMGINLGELGQPARAEAAYREALALSARNKTIAPVAYEWIDYRLAGLLLNQRRFEEAEPLALRALAIRDSASGPADADTRQSMDQIVKLYQAWGKPDWAAKYQRSPAPP